MSFFRKNRVFLDYASTTPIDRAVLGEMQKYQSDTFANPSALYSEALLAKEKLNQARGRIADLINAQEKEVFFTSGGTESNNLALLGVFDAHKKEAFVPHIITTDVEHPAILEVCREIERRGGEVTYVGVSEEGILNPKDVRDALRPNTVLVSVMYANNEIGTIQPIKEIGRVVKDWRQKNKTDFPYFHTDACQAPLYLSVDVLKLGLDMMTLDGIKIYGPRGTGMLYIKSDTKISPVIFGGGQERGLRSGTENVASAMGFAKALEIADKKREEESERLMALRDYGISQILKRFPKASLNGSHDFRLPNNINICFPELDAEFAVISLDVVGISASYSSSCQTLKEDSSSYVISSLGKDTCKNSYLRFTLGRESEMGDIDRLLLALSKIVLQ